MSRKIDKGAIGHLPQTIQNRIKRSKKAKFRGDFFRRDTSGNPQELLCRLCSVAIAGWVPGTTIRSDRPVPMQFLHFANFRMLVLKLSDGSNYRTNMCVDCVDKVDANDPDELEDLFCSDIEGWARAAKAARVSPADHAKGFERIHGLSVIPGDKKVLD